MDDDARILLEQANGHRIYGASKASRFLACAGSLRAEFGLPDTARYEAAEGTVAHEICDQWMKTGYPPRNRIGEVVTMELATGTYYIPIDEAMLTHCSQHVQRCLGASGDHFFEQFVDYSELTPIPDQGGTGDHFTCAFRSLTLDDFKYGVADQIYAFQNPQVSLYAIGVIFKWDWLYSFEKVTIRINQPRLNHFDVWETTVEELMAFAETAKVKMFEAWAPNAPRTPSEKACCYCKAKLNCPEAAQLAGEVIDTIFVDESQSYEVLTGTPAIWTDRPPAKIAFNPQWERQATPVLVNMLQWRKLLEKLFQEAHDELSSRIHSGEKVEGWMRADGKRSRSVRDRDGVLKVFRDHGLSPTAAYIIDFLSPAKLEATLIKIGVSKGAAEKLLEPYVRTLPGQPVATQIKRGKKEAKSIDADVFEDESLGL